MKERSEHRYRRLPGRPFAALRRDSLWLADDHLFSVRSNRFSEDYRRYYFRDIQAIIIQRTAPVSLWTYVTAALAAAFLTPGLLFEFQNAFLWILGGLFLALTLVLIGRGPACVCYIQTAVSRDALGSLRWISVAEKALRVLQPCIEQVQGPFSAEMVTLSSQPPPLITAAVTPPPLPARKPPETGWGYEFVFTLFLLDSLHSYLSLSHKGTAMNVSAWIILITEIVCMPWLLIRQRRFEVPGAIRALVIVALIATAGFTYAVNFLSTLGTQLRLAADRYPGFIPLHMTAIAVYAVLGAAGLVLITRHRHGLHRLPPLVNPE